MPPNAQCIIPIIDTLSMLEGGGVVSMTRRALFLSPFSVFNVIATGCYAAVIAIAGIYRCKNSAG